MGRPREYVGQRQVLGMPTKSVQIGSVTVLARTSEWTIKPDDRQTRIEVVGGVAVEDYGHIPAGDVVSSKFRLRAADWDTIKGYWENRTKVTVTDEAGNAYADIRVVVTGWSRIDRFPDTIMATIDFWRC